MIFGTHRRWAEKPDAERGKPRIGIPRALLTHSLYPLYFTFLSSLGMDVVLSGLDPRGELKSYSGFCFPAQTAHGAVLDLANQGVGLIFLPHVKRMPRPGPCHDSYLCPISQASPFFLAAAFPEMRILSPVLDLSRGYEYGPELEELFAQELGIGCEAIGQAWEAAKNAQQAAERAMQELGQKALERALLDGKPAILLAGRSYNAYAPEASQSIGRKLSSMGVAAIPADCLVPVEEGPLAWHFSNQILNAMALAKKHPNLFLVCISNFSCTVDAFTHAEVAAGMGAKPYLILEIDAHTADAGIQTRIEAFLDIVRHYHAAAVVQCEPFTSVPDRQQQPDRPDQWRDRVHERSAREPSISPTFPRSILRPWRMAFRWAGLHTGEIAPLDRTQLERGLQYTSGRECLPLPLCIGQMLKINESRKPGEIAGFYMLKGGAPCVLDAYLDFLRRFIAEQRLPDLFLFAPTEENGQSAMDRMTLAKNSAQTLIVADLVVEIEHVLRVVGAEGSVDRLRRLWTGLAATDSEARLQAELPGFVRQIAALPRIR